LTFLDCLQFISFEVRFILSRWKNKSDSFNEILSANLKSMIFACLSLIFEIAIVDEANVEFKDDLVILQIIKIRKVTMLFYTQIIVGFFINNDWSLTIDLTTTYSWSHCLIWRLVNSLGSYKRKLIVDFLKGNIAAIHFS
jgi:hypothetical protein